MILLGEYEILTKLFLFSEESSIYVEHDKQNMSSSLVLGFFTPKCDFPLVSRPPYMMLDLSMMLTAGSTYFVSGMLSGQCVPPSIL